MVSSSHSCDERTIHYHYHSYGEETFHYYDERTIHILWMEESHPYVNAKEPYPSNGDANFHHGFCFAHTNG